MIAGKTTLLKGKAVSLARSGKSVSYIVMGGSERTESVMSIATKLDFAQYHPAIKVISRQELKEFYWSLQPICRWPRWPITTSPLSLLLFYMEKENPENVIVDELPLEKSNWRQLFLMPMSVLSVFLSSLESFNFNLILSLLACTVLLKFSESSEPEWMPILLADYASALNTCLTWILIALYAYIIIGFYVDRIVSPFNLGKTSSLLLSLPRLLHGSSSTLWLALHSQPFSENQNNPNKRPSTINQAAEVYAFLTCNTAEMLSRVEKRLEQWRNSLKLCFSVPILKHNLRNCNEVAEIKEPRGTEHMTNSQVPVISLHASPPRVPPSLPPTSTFCPLNLPIHAAEQTTKAIKYAYDKMGRPTTLVLLFDAKDQLSEAKDILTQEGLRVVTYNNPDNSQDCKSFLQNQDGVLITTPALFSGMEAANVIWVMTQNDRNLTRSNKLRAIEKLCVIDQNSADRILAPTSDHGFKVDGEFAKCHWPAFETLFKCQSHQPIILCRSCAIVCHQSCDVERHKFRSNLHNLIGYILPHNPCSCPASGQCQLERASWLSSVSFARISAVVSLSVYVLVFAATGSGRISYFVFMCLYFIFLVYSCSVFPA